MPSPATAAAAAIVASDSGLPASAASTFASRIACVLAPVRPTRAAVIVPPDTSSDAPTPTMAKCDARWCSFA